MENRLVFELDGREYDLTAPTALQLMTFRRIVQVSYDGGGIVRLLGSPKAIIDVGACIGSISLMYATLWPDATVVALEPHPISFEHLVKNCANFPNIACRRIAASDKHERFRLALPLPEQRSDELIRYGIANIGMVSRYGNSSHYVAEVDAMPLDELVDGPVDLIKIDVEGMEQAVIHGAAKTIGEYHPTLVVEVRGANQRMAGTWPSALIGLLASMGYGPVGKMAEDLVFRHWSALCSS